MWHRWPPQGPAYAVFGGRRRKAVPDSGELDRWVDLSWPVLKNLGFSGVLGVLAAFAFKVSNFLAARNVAISVDFI